MNLGLLFFFKYWDFFGETVNALAAQIGIGCCTAAFSASAWWPASAGSIDFAE